MQESVRCGWGRETLIWPGIYSGRLSDSGFSVFVTAKERGRARPAARVEAGPAGATRGRWAHTRWWDSRLTASVRLPGPPLHRPGRKADADEVAKAKKKKKKTKRERIFFFLQSGGSFRRCFHRNTDEKTPD